MTKAITFLGIYPQSTTYIMPDGNICTAQFFGAALARLVPGLEFYVFVTDKAAENSLDKFTEEVTGQVAELTPVRIPDGDNEEQLWQIFEKVIEVVAERDQVIFDITHSFRSVTFLSFLAAAYLRTVKQIDLVSVLYGNYEAAKKHSSGYAPVIDMTSFISLLDWMTAAERFMRFGDASDLAQQLARTKPDHRTATQQDFRAWKETGIPKLARTLTEVSQALTLIRPFDAMIAGDRLRTDLPRSVSAAGKLARPLAPLSRHITATFSPLGQNERQIKTDRAGALTVERALIHWYLERKQLVQAAAVGREWLISYVMLHTLGAGQDPLDRHARQRVEQALGTALQMAQNKALEPEMDTDEDSRPISEVQPVDLTAVPELDQLIDLYNTLGEARNDLMHAGKRAGAKSAATLSEQIEALCQKLESLPIPNGDEAPR